MHVNNLAVTLSLGKKLASMALVDLVAVTMPPEAAVACVEERQRPKRKRSDQQGCVVKTSLLDVVQNWLNISHWVTIASNH